MDIHEKTVNTIRILAADMVQQANSGHPGAPMGMAPMAYALWAGAMHHNPADPNWVNRDRFVLSSGHASALEYALLHLFQYGLTMDDLKQFRQWGSKTPGHPEYGHTAGVETTTGPLGQGIANAVGFAIAETMLAAKFNRDGFPVIDHQTYCICGDGCMMEGIASEAASLAGTLKLGKLTLLYDDNEISIEGDTDIAMLEDVPARFRAYGWHVIELSDGNDVSSISAALAAAKADDRPSLIVLPTTIGFGCPAKAGKASAHGEPLGTDNLTAARECLGMPAEPFSVLPEVYAHLGKTAAAGEKAQSEWNRMFAAYADAYPTLAAEWAQWFGDQLPDFDDPGFWEYPDSEATRNTSQTMIKRIANLIPNLVGGSADLAPSNKCVIPNGGDYSANNRIGRNLHFGVREHAMAAICNGIALHGGLRVFCATFFVFSDYMKNAMRLSAIMKLPVTYILTHDSIGVGEDGPTHQPIEHLAGLRAIPGLLVFRPADGPETTAAWMTALTDGRPTCLVLSRQNLKKQPSSGKDACNGGYIISDSKGETPAALLMGSGSEVEPLMQVQRQLWDQGVDARVISMPCMELYDEQTQAYRESVMPDTVRNRLAMEAGSSMPWYKYIGLDGKAVCIDCYGASAPPSVLFEAFGLTADHALHVLQGVWAATDNASTMK